VKRVENIYNGQHEVSSRMNDIRESELYTTYSGLQQTAYLLEKTILGNRS